MLTLLPPVKVPMLVDNTPALYVAPGDPLGVRHLCEQWVHKVLGRELNHLETVRIQLVLVEDSERA